MQADERLRHQVVLGRRRGVAAHGRWRLHDGVPVTPRPRPRRRRRRRRLLGLTTDFTWLSLRQLVDVCSSSTSRSSFFSTVIAWFVAINFLHR